VNTNPYDADTLWTKARMFIHRAMDDGREFEEQAFWSACAFELLGKAALAKVSPILIANPNPDGHSLLVASGLVDVDDKFWTVPAKALWSRCNRVFRPFNEKEAAHISAVRNDYLHAGGVGKEGTPETWWPRFWAQAVILVSHLDWSLADLVGTSRVRVVEGYLAKNRENLAQRLEAAIDRARKRLALHESGQLSTALEKAWDAFFPYSYSHSTSETCPACGHVGTLAGDTVHDTRREVVMSRIGDWEYQDTEVWDDVGTEAFYCGHCHLELSDYDILNEAGFPESFEVEGDPEAYEYEPEYDNE
jgi:hypothetical protein